MAPQQVEKIEFAPGNGMVPEAANPLDVVNGRAADRARFGKNDKVAKVAEKGAQDFEIARCKLKSAPVAAGNAGRARWRGIVREGLERADRRPVAGRSDSAGFPRRAVWPKSPSSTTSSPSRTERHSIEQPARQSRAVAAADRRHRLVLATVSRLRPPR